MAKKTYRTYSLKGLQLMLRDPDGKRVEIVFRSGIQIDSTAKFSTSEEKLQEMIEGCHGFNRDFYLESVQEEKKAVEPKKEPVAPKELEKPAMADVKDIKRFHNIVEMRNYMAELGFDGVENMNYMQAKSAAAKEGYDFQIQKK